MTLWQLRTLPPLQAWVKGRLALLGDACHPMMPHLGQGGGQSIEDGAALGVLFPLGARPESVEARLKVYQHVRKERAETVQDFSRKLGMAKKGMGYSGKSPELLGCCPCGSGLIVRMQRRRCTSISSPIGWRSMRSRACQRSLSRRMARRISAFCRFCISGNGNGNGNG